MHRLNRWNTPAVHNGWEQTTQRDIAFHQEESRDHRRYVASVDGPKIVVVQDLDKPRTVGSFWGEVNSGAHRALGCVGTITDGAIRDLDEMTGAAAEHYGRQGESR
ncbi:hypothetical protein ABT158_19525 [Nonomuraea sp. NPDC001636]|uniref:RraA family protein n=1 Tax=Nonomuraea sp. NPDC001636 TaxID=3154391 RepID=UPI003327B187